MLVFGDAARTVPALEKYARLSGAVRAGYALQPGLARHSALLAAFLEAGELAQGIADHDLRRTGAEANSPAQSAACTMLRQLARTVWLSWQSGFSRLPPLPATPLSIDGLPETIETKLCEGFAHYAVYPETYAAAAAGSGLSAATHVIGIRSIGTSLAAMVAEALGASAVSTVRPTGHPFRRELRLEQAARHALLAPAAGYAVVDEGPGLSGSSFGAVADFLEDHGIAPERITLFPSHAGAPGPQASERHRARWPRMARRFVPFETLFLTTDRREHRLGAWAANLLGVVETQLEDISGGAWRRPCYRGEDDWPPVHAQQERRKFLMHTGSGTWLLKFAGLGRVGQTKLALARRLAAAGFIPPIAGECHGFLVERWLSAARPLSQRATVAAESGAAESVEEEAVGAPRPRRISPMTLAEHVGRYLGFRARSFPADTQGASTRRLLEMAHYNAAQALGSGVASRLDRWVPALDRVSTYVRPVITDNRMHAWEWLVLPDGRVLKTDALDHHTGHDLIGCQDIAWDVVGAAVELDLPPLAQARLLAALEREAGRAPHPDLLAFYTPCYLAFQLGYWTMAGDVAPQAEVPRLRAMSARYAERLRCLLSGSPAPPAPAPSH